MDGWEEGGREEVKVMLLLIRGEGGNVRVEGYERQVYTKAILNESVYTHGYICGLSQEKEVSRKDRESCLSEDGVGLTERGLETQRQTVDGWLGELRESERMQA